MGSMPDSAVLADYLDVTRARAKLLCSVEHGNDHALRSTSGRATRPHLEIEEVRNNREGRKAGTWPIFPAFLHSLFDFLSCKNSRSCERLRFLILHPPGES